jgi:hypothetical protein
MAKQLLHQLTRLKIHEGSTVPLGAGVDVAFRLIKRRAVEAAGAAGRLLTREIPMPLFGSTKKAEAPKAPEAPTTAQAMVEQVVGMTLEEVLAKLSDEERAVIQAALQEAKQSAGAPPAPATPMAEQQAKALKVLGIIAKANVAPKVPESTDPAEKARRAAQAPGIPTEVAKRFEELEKENASTKAELAKAREEREVGQFTAKARAELAHLPVSAETLGPALRAMQALPESARKVLEQTLKAANEAWRYADLELLVAKGVEGAGSRKADTPEGEIDEIAKRLQAKDPKLSAAKARVLAVKSRKDLYRQHVEGLGRK